MNTVYFGPAGSTDNLKSLGAKTALQIPSALKKMGLNAFEYQNISVQNTPGLGTDIYCREWHVDPEVPMGEDCLYLNIWTPAKKTDEKLPVLVWYFGGAFQWGYTSEMEFDGERLARRGIIVVTVNYRLNIFGFLAHPEITAEKVYREFMVGGVSKDAEAEYKRLFAVDKHFKRIAAKEEPEVIITEEEQKEKIKQLKNANQTNAK